MSVCILRLPRKLGVKPGYLSWIRFEAQRFAVQSQNNKELLTPTAAARRLNANPFAFAQPNIKLAGQRL